MWNSSSSSFVLHDLILKCAVQLFYTRSFNLHDDSSWLNLDCAFLQEYHRSYLVSFSGYHIVRLTCRQGHLKTLSGPHALTIPYRKKTIVHFPESVPSWQTSVLFVPLLAVLSLTIWCRWCLPSLSNIYISFITNESHMEEYFETMQTLSFSKTIIIIIFWMRGYVLMSAGTHRSQRCQGPLEL